MRKSGFTLIELLIVITILGILAAAIIPNFIGFDKDARVAATKSNLNAIRGSITLFRAKEGRYPYTIQELVTKTSFDAGIEKPYLKKVPREMISSSDGNNSCENQKSNRPLTGDGGWTYLTDKAEVVIDWLEPLDKSWESYENQKPCEW